MFKLDRWLVHCYIDGSRAFLALLDVKGDTITLIQRFETNSIDAWMMFKHIRAIFLLDESKTFTGIKPLNNSAIHGYILLPKYFQKF